MNVIYQSVKFDAKNILSTYARLYSNGEVKLFDVDKKHKTIREYWVKLEELQNVDKLIVGETVLYSGLSLQQRKGIK